MISYVKAAIKYTYMFRIISLTVLFILTLSKTFGQGKWASIRDTLLKINYQHYSETLDQGTHSIAASNAIFVDCCESWKSFYEKDDSSCTELSKLDFDSVKYLSLNNTCEPDTAISRFHSIQLLLLNGGSYYPSFLTDFNRLEYIIDFSFNKKTTVNGNTKHKHPGLNSVRCLFVKYYFNDFHYSCTEIEELALQLNERIPSLSKFNKLEFLYVNGGSYSNLVTEVLKCNTLTYLELYHSAQRKFDMESLVHLVKHPNLKHIDYYISAEDCLQNRKGIRRMSEIKRILANSGIEVRFFGEVLEKSVWNFRLIDV